MFKLALISAYFPNDDFTVNKIDINTAYGSNLNYM